jgi:predicted AlkP superfamily pyrophosphatase or phosphodiesterase
VEVDLKPWRTSLRIPTLAAFAFAALAFTTAAAQPPAASAANKVVVISLDAFGAASLRDPHLPAPTLRRLMQAGAYAAMQPINPTVTWPNHTSMVTGVDASRHHVVTNGLITNQRAATAPQSGDAPKSQLVAAPTVYDAAHQAGLTTAQVDWVAIHEADSIDWKFSEKPDPDGPIERDLIAEGALTRDDLLHFRAPSQAWRDRIYTRAAVDILRRHHPDLLLLHLLTLDDIEHKTGFGNDSGLNTIAFLDDRVKEVVDAVRENGDLDRTTFIIVSDHGQQSVHWIARASVLLKQAGLEGATAPNPAFCMSDGGFALVFQQHPTAESVAALKTLFSGQPGIRAALTPEEAAKDGWPTPAASDQAPDLLLYAADDYVLFDGDTGSYLTATKEIGAHGYPNTVPLMQSIFIAEGYGIAAKGELPAFTNLDVAPTIARLLHLSLPNVEGKPLLEILK